MALSAKHRRPTWLLAVPILSVLLALGPWSGLVADTDSDQDSGAPAKPSEYKLDFLSVSPDKKHQLVEISRPWRSGSDQMEAHILLEKGGMNEALDQRYEGAFMILGDEAIGQASWTSDGKYCLFSHCSINGHSPWHNPIEVLDLQSLNLCPVEPLIGTAIIKPEFTLGDDGMIHMTIAGVDTKNGGWNIDDEVKKSVSLADVLNAVKK
jgi:hypothetical protein